MTKIVIATILMWCPAQDMFYETNLTKKEALKSDYYQNYCVPEVPLIFIEERCGEKLPEN